MELGLIGQLELIQGFQEEFRDFPISDVLPDFIEQMKVVAETKKYLSSSAGSPERNEYYEECEKYFLKLNTFTTKFTAAREELNKKRTNFQNQEQRATKAERTAKRNSLIALIATVAAVAGVLVNITSSKPATEASEAKHSNTSSDRQIIVNPERKHLNQRVQNQDN